MFKNQQSVLVSLDIYSGLNPNSLKSTNAFLLTFQGFGVNFQLLTALPHPHNEKLRDVFNDREAETCNKGLWLKQAKFLC